MADSWQPIELIAAPSGAEAFSLGHEDEPAALSTAGIARRMVVVGLKAHDSQGSQP